MALQIAKLINKIKSKIGVGSSSVVGVDVGLSSVKIAEMSCNHNSKKYTLLRYISIPFPEGVIIEDEIQKKDEVIQAIVEGLESGGFLTRSAVIGIGGPNTIARKLQLAGGSEEEIEDQVIWESEQYLPFDIEESNVSFHLLGENAGGGVDVIVGAARNDVIENYKDIVEEAELKVKVVDLSILALVNLFEASFGRDIENENESYLLLDLGAQKTSFVIYKAGMVLFTKEVNVGGIMITEEIQRQMGVNYLEAEDLKITGDENGNLPEEILEIIDEVVESFFAELKKTMDFYISSTSDESLRVCYITGGSAQIPGFFEGLEALLGVKVEVLNPFEYFTYDKKSFDESELQNIVFKGAVALGLAMRDS